MHKNASFLFRIASVCLPAAASLTDRPVHPDRYSPFFGNISSRPRNKCKMVFCLTLYGNYVMLGDGVVSTLIEEKFCSVL
jgi:hypothetical protein